MMEVKNSMQGPVSYHPMKTGPTALFSFTIGMHAVTDTVRAVNKNYEAIRTDVKARKKYEDLFTFLCNYSFAYLYDEQPSIRVTWEPTQLNIRAGNDVTKHGFDIYEEECLREDLAD